MRRNSYAKRIVGGQLILQRFKNQAVKESLTLALNLRKRFLMSPLTSYYLFDVPLELEWDRSFMVFILLRMVIHLSVIVHW